MRKLLFVKHLNKQVVHKVMGFILVLVGVLKCFRAANVSTCLVQTEMSQSKYEMSEILYRRSCFPQDRL